MYIFTSFEVFDRPLIELNKERRLKLPADISKKAANDMCIVKFKTFHSWGKNL